MSWCTAAEVAELIAVARLRSDVDAAARKAADLRFIELCTTAINAGDVLMQIATEASASAGLRLNAVFAAQPLLTRVGWVEGGQFSDRSSVTQALLRLTGDATFDARAKINAELLRSLSMIISLEYPREEWQQWLQNCACAFAAGDLAAAAKLRAVVHESYRNYALWAFLAGDVTGFLLHAGLTALPQRTLVVNTFLELMRKRPRPSADHEIATADNCVLLSAGMRQFIMAALLARVTEAQDGAEATAGFVDDCTAAFAVAARLVTDVDSAANVFRCSSFFLAHLQSSAAQGAMDDASTALAEQLLECLLSTLQLFPEVASGDVQADALLTCLIHFMVPAEEAERVDVAQLSAELLEFFMDDEAVPLGCGSGDVAHLAGAVLELFLEHNPAQREAAVITLNGILRSTPNIRSTLADAVALALRSISRVYEAADAVVVDTLDAATQAELLTQVAQLLLATTDAHAQVMVMEAMTHCFYRTRNEALCRQLVQLLEKLYTNAVTSFCADAAGCVRCACIYEAGRLVEEARGEPWCGTLLSEGWAGLALEQLASGDTFGVFCAASTLCTLLYAVPGCAHYLSLHAAEWTRGLYQLCRHATLRSVAVLLTLALKHLAGITASGTATSPHECCLLATSCDVVLSFCQQPSPSRHLVLRSLVDFIAAHSRVYLRGVGCAACAQQLSHATAPLLTEPFSSELVQEEPSCRGFATAVGLQCAALANAQPTMASAVCAALLRGLQHAAQHTFASQTISCICSHLGLVVVPQPALLDEAATHVLQTLFRPGVDLVEGRKGVNYGGVAFFLSLLFLRHPQSLLHAAGATRADAQSTDAVALQQAFGWWLSLAPFMDALQFPYFAAACCRVVEASHAMSGAAAGSSSSPLIVPLAFCQQHVLPSLHVKKLPSRPLTNASVLQHLSLAWVDLGRRYSSTSKPQLVDKELHPYIASVQAHYPVLTGATFAGSAAAALLRASAAESIAAVGDYLSQEDGGAACNAARQLLSASTR